MDRDHKIEKINAYRKLLKTRRLPQVSDEESEGSSVSKELHVEFESWVSSQISILLGETLASPAVTNLPFNDEEIDVLKTLIAGVKARRAAPSQEAEQKPQQRLQVRPAAPVQQASLSDAERARLNASAKPMGNRKMVDSSRKNDNDSLVSELDRMEDQGPQF